MPDSRPLDPVLPPASPADLGDAPTPPPSPTPLKPEGERDQRGVADKGGDFSTERE